MRNRLWVVLILAVVPLALFSEDDGLKSNEPGSCATFLLERGPSIVVGHNLDENIKMPGLIVINPRGVAKENITLDDIKSAGRQDSVPRLKWISRYGSVTYNFFGKEFPDGGMNEAGFYVGEMTLIGTVWPENTDLPRMYHNQWMQYLLDNFAGVDEALASLGKALPEGHCQWHFFMADKTGKAAVVEFLNGKPLIYTDTKLPYKILCNDPYEPELKDIANYEGFGGAKKPAPRYEREDPRFRWAALMFREYSKDDTPVDYAFRILKRMDLGNNKWAIVYDVPGMKLYFRTSVETNIKWIDVSALDFLCARLTRAIDIDQKAEGEATNRFTTLTDSWNRSAVAKSWEGIDAGFAGNLFWKPRMAKGMGVMSAIFKCEEKQQ